MKARTNKTKGQKLPELRPGETLDDLLHGELKLIQHERGYRYSVDALLLAAFALPLVRGKAVLDLGAGPGTVALILAQRGAPSRMVAVEIQEGLAELARRNADLNPTRPKVEVFHADGQDLSALFAEGSFSVVVTNPPFRRKDSGRISSNPEKAIARHEVLMTLKPWLKEAMRVLEPEGALAVVYPVDEEKRLMNTAGSLGLHVRRRQYALDRPRGNKRLVLVEFRKLPCQEERLPDIPIETEQGKFSLDGYK